MKLIVLCLYYDLAALVPLAEFCDPEVMHGYGVKPEPDVLELLELISKQLEVLYSIIDLSIFDFTNVVYTN